MGQLNQMAKSYRITIDVAYSPASGDVPAEVIKEHLLGELSAASFPGIIRGFGITVKPLEDGGKLIESLDGLESLKDGASEPT